MARCRCYDEDEMVCGYYEGYCGCRCHTADDLEPVKRTYDADELGIDQEDD